MNFICQVFVCAVLTLWQLVGLASSGENARPGAAAASNSNDGSHRVVQRVRPRPPRQAPQTPRAMGRCLAPMHRIFRPVPG
jgi:hypothetical protein